MSVKRKIHEEHGQKITQQLQDALKTAAYYFALSGGISFFVPVQVLLGGSQHQFDPVELVDLGSTRIVVDGRYIGLGIEPADLLDDALAHDVVGEAAEGLDADDVGNAALYKLHHLAGQGSKCLLFAYSLFMGFKSVSIRWMAALHTRAVLLLVPRFSAL